MRCLKIVVVIALFAIFGVGVIHADEAPLEVPTFSDGRVNNWHIDAPVAVYCIFDHSEDVNVGVFHRVEAWGLNSAKLLEVTAAEIEAAKVGDTLASSGGHVLTLAAADMFQISAPNGYTFTWSRGDMNC